MSRLAVYPREQCYGVGGVAVRGALLFFGSLPTYTVCLFRPRYQSHKKIFRRNFYAI
jgi:hypothetical protein